MCTGAEALSEIIRHLQKVQLVLLEKTLLGEKAYDVGRPT